jgi:type I restriction enzyme S subunit
VAELRIDQVCSIVVDCEHKTVPEDLYGSAWAVGTPAMTDGRIDFSRAKRISDDTYDLWTRRAVPVEGDLILAREAPVGPVVRVPASPKVALGQRTVLLRPRPDVIDSRYLHFLLMSSDMQHQMHSKSEGSTVRHLNVEDVRALPLPPLPLLLEQRAIVEVLGALDDKVESNRRLTTTIEKIVPLIFQSMTSESEIKLLTEVARLQKGISYRSVDLEDSETAMVTLKSYDRNGGYKSNGLKPYVGKYKPEQVLLPGDMAVAQTDLTQGAEVVGRVIRIPSQEDFKTLVASLDLVIVRPLDAADETYLYGALLQEDFREHCRSRTSGTTVLHLGSDALPKYLIPWADGEVRRAFADEVQPLLEEHDSLTKESATLERLRDALSPELLSGRLRVKDAASMMENV